MTLEADTVEAHGLTWLVVREFAATLPRLDLERARRPEALTDKECVKDNTVRTVLRMPDPDRPDGPGLYVKRYKFRSRSERLKHLFLPTKPQVEWRTSRLLREAGIPTCDVLAIAVRRRHGVPVEGFLVSREVEGAPSVPDFLRTRTPNADERRALIEDVADVTARLARAGLYHSDYHAGNLLIRPDAPPGKRLFVVDQHSVHRRRATPRHLLHMLAMFTRSIGLPGASARDCAALLTAFLRRWTGREDVPADVVAAWSRGLAGEQRRQHRIHMRSRTRRCLKNSSLFTIESAPGFRVHRRRDFPLSAALDAVWCHTDAVRGARPDAHVLHKGRRTEVTVCACDTVPPFDVSQPAPPSMLRKGRVCVKSFRRDPLKERIKDVMRPRSRALEMWVAARGFRVRGVPAARPLAVLESRRKLSGAPDYVVMEALDNDGDLARLVAEGSLDEADRRRLAGALARLLNQLADEEIYHPDTKPTNLLVKREDGDFRLWLVDLDRARLGTRVTRNRWVKCLARLNAGLSGRIGLLDRMRCLRLCSRGRWPAAERLRIAHEVYALSLTRRVAWET